MTNPTFIGYLNDPYTADPYLGDTGLHSWGMQCKRVIVDSLVPKGMQSARHINNNPGPLAMAAARHINNQVDPLAMATARHIVDSLKPMAMQTTLDVDNAPDGLAMETALHIVDHATPPAVQAARFIVDHLKPLAMQTTLDIDNAPDGLAMQVNAMVEDSGTLAMQVLRITALSSKDGMQAARHIVDFAMAQGMQLERIVETDHKTGMQIERVDVGFPSPHGMQIARGVNLGDSVGMEIRCDASFPHWLAPELGYLSEGYLEGPYLVRGYFVQGPMQVARMLKDVKAPQAMQVQRNINTNHDQGMQVSSVIADFTKTFGMQISILRSFIHGMQVRLVLYNTNLLRVMSEFPSRGVTGTNWTATSTETGDFSVNNLNTDIVEQVWRSQAGTMSAILACDTQIPQGITVDTLALLGHNLTTSATVTVEASNSNTFSPVGFSVGLNVTKENAYYIAPTFPTQQFRYWRLVISDPTNPMGFVQIGTVVFGNTIILQGECFVDQVPKTKKHFVDKIPTEGFTNASNDRALRKAVTLDFKNLAYARGNYNNLQDLFDFARTSLKCLWIPDPQKVTRFTVFAKLVTMPAERHLNMGPEADFVDLTIELDESL